MKTFERSLASQLLVETPALQTEAVLLMLGLNLTESQLFNIEKSDLMSVLQDEPGFITRNPPNRWRPRASFGPHAGTAL